LVPKAKARKSSKGRGRGKSKEKPVDNVENLTEETKGFHENLSEVPIPDDGISSWKSQVFYQFRIKSDTEVRDYFLNNCIKHLSDLGREKNKRIYIGPGRDGSSDDKKLL